MENNKLQRLLNWNSFVKCVENNVMMKMDFDAI